MKDKLEILITASLLIGLILLGVGLVQFVLKIMAHFGLDSELRLAVIGLSLVVFTLIFARLLSEE